MGQVSPGYQTGPASPGESRAGSDLEWTGLQIGLRNSRTASKGRLRSAPLWVGPITGEKRRAQNTQLSTSASGAWARLSCITPQLTHNRLCASYLVHGTLSLLGIPSVFLALLGPRFHPRRCFAVGANDAEYILRKKYLIHFRATVVCLIVMAGSWRSVARVAFALEIAVENPDVGRSELGAG